MRTAPSFVFVFGITLVVLVTGCRTYGERGAGAQTHEEMGEAVHELEESLRSAHENLRQLRAAAQQADTLQHLVDRYETLVKMHEATVDRQQHTVDALSPESSYRTLHHNYGALITENRLLQAQYDRTIRKVYAVVRDTVPPTPAARAPSTYNVTPIGYPQVQRHITMVEALRPVEGAPGLQQREGSAGS